MLQYENTRRLGFRVAGEPFSVARNPPEVCQISKFTAIHLHS